MSDNSSTLRTGITGLAVATVSGVVNWYSEHLAYLNQWLLHITQVGGFVVTVYTVMILRRNWNKGSSSRNVLQSLD